MMNKETIKKIGWKDKKTWIGIFIIMGALLVITPQKSLGITAPSTVLERVSNTSVNITEEKFNIYSVKNVGSKVAIVDIHCDSKMIFCLNGHCGTGKGAGEKVFTDRLNFSLKSNETLKFLPGAPYEKFVKCDITIDGKQAYILYAEGPRGGLPGPRTRSHDYLNSILVSGVFVAIIVSVLIVFVLIRRRRRSEDRRE